MPSLSLVSRFALRMACTSAACGGLLVAMPLLSESAWAQSAPVFEGAGVIELLPPTGLVGDGSTSADLYVLALGPDGRPIPGLKTKPTTSAGTTTDMADLGGGLYRFGFTPPKVDGPTQVTLTVKGKLPSKEAYTRAWTVSVAPARSRKLSASANPAVMTLNQDRTASLAFNLAGGDRQALGGVNLKVNSSSGAVDNLTHLGGGQFSALFTAPTVNYPHVALITAVDSRDPTHTYGGMAVQLVGKADYPVTVASGARVMLVVGGREFGPIQADAQGRAKVPIVVPPGASNAIKRQISADNKVTEEPLDLKIPEAKRIALFPSSPSIPSDGRIQVPIRAFVVTADGRPDESGQVVFSATAGTVSPARHEGGGIYVATFTPPYGNTTTQATIAVNLADQPALQADSLTINLVPARASKVTLTTEPTLLPPGADGFKLFAKVTGPDGTGLGARELQFAVNGARVKGDIKDLRNGDYQVMFTTTGPGSVDLSASVVAPQTGNPMAHLLVLPTRDRLPADGLSSAMLTVATVDEYGYPVANVLVTLKVARGDGAVPGTVTTGANGLAQIYYTAGHKNAFVAIEATAGEYVAGASLLQVPVGTVIPTLPASGSKAVVALAGEWAGSLAGVRLEREGMTGPSAPPVQVAAATVGKPVKIGLLSEPVTASAGGTVTLRVNLTDENGRGVGGKQLDFLTSTGTVSNVTDLGGGAYQASLVLPSSATGEVKVSVATVDGAASSFMRVPIGGADTAWGNNPFGAATSDPFAATSPTAPPAATQPVAATPAPTTTAPTLTPAPATTTTTVAKVPRTPKAPSGDRPFLRVRGGFTLGGYSYDQQPLTSATVLFPKAIALDASSLGFSADAKLWLPMLPYLGADVAVTTNRYTLDPTDLCAALGKPCDDAAAVGDMVTDIHALVAGRYPFDVGASQFWIGARAGFARSDVQAFKVVQDQIELEQLSINSLSVGPEVGAEIGEKLFFHTYFLENLAGGSTPFDSQFGVMGGFAFLPNLYAALAYDFSGRKVEIANGDGKPVGEISDVRHLGTLSVGVQF